MDGRKRDFSEEFGRAPRGRTPHLPDRPVSLFPAPVTILRLPVTRLYDSTSAFSRRFVALNRRGRCRFIAAGARPTRGHSSHPLRSLVRPALREELRLL